MHEFEAGVTKMARARLFNTKAMQIACEAELYLGPAKDASSGPVIASVPAGGYADVNFTLAVPSVEAEYPVFLDALFAGEVIARYQSPESVAIVRQSFQYSNASIAADWQIGPSYWNWVRYSTLITNIGTKATTKNVSLIYRQKLPSWSEFSIEGAYRSYQLTLGAGEMYLFDSCAIEGITGPGYTTGGDTLMITDYGGFAGMIYEVWLRDSDGLESTHLRVSKGVMMYIYMTFRDTTGITREINMTMMSITTGYMVEELKQAYINGGFAFVSQRTGPLI